jgi:hypothetical protein
MKPKIKISTEFMQKYQSLLVELNENIATLNDMWEFESKKHKKHGIDWFRSEASIPYRNYVVILVNRINKLRNKLNQFNMILQKNGITANKYTVL